MVILASLVSKVQLQRDSSPNRQPRRALNDRSVQNEAGSNSLGCLASLWAFRAVSADPAPPKDAWPRHRALSWRSISVENPAKPTSTQDLGTSPWLRRSSGGTSTESWRSFDLLLRAERS